MSRSQIVIIGSGPGGSLTAALLAEAGFDVTILEQGKHLLLSSAKSFSQKEMIQKYKNSGITVALGNPKISYIEGACVGGGSEINSGLYHRTPSDIIKNWEKNYSVLDLDLSVLEKFFKKNEEDLNVCLMPSHLMPKASLMLHHGALSLGWNSLEIPRWVKYNDKSSIKQSMTETFIPRAINSGAKLLDGIKINYIKRKVGSWHINGIDLKTSKAFKINAENVFLCGGAISTAQILKKSRLSILAGNSLRMHPSVKMVARFSEEVNDLDMGVPVHQIKEFSPEISLGCSISTPPYLHLAMQGIKNGDYLVTKHWKKMAIYYAMTAEGEGRIINLPFIKDPLVTYKVGQHGIKNLLNGLLKLGECLFKAGAIEIYPAVHNSLPVKNINELYNFVKVLSADKLNLMTIHLFSSCPMGENKKICVADSYGRVHGYDNLYINDSSLLCSAPTVNPQGTIMMLARRNIEHFLDSY